MRARVSEEEKRRKARIRSNRWYHAHKHLVAIRSKGWNKKCRPRYIPLRELSSVKRAARLQRQKAWREKNPEKMRRYDLKSRKNPQIVIKKRVRARISKMLRIKGARRSYRVVEIIGCSWGFLKSHIENSFLPGMSWENRNLWHVDHVKPCAKFDLTDPEQQKACFHFTNLQPLWAEDNMKKWAHYAV